MQPCVQQRPRTQVRYNISAGPCVLACAVATRAATVRSGRRVWTRTGVCGQQGLLTRARPACRAGDCGVLRGALVLTSWRRLRQRGPGSCRRTLARLGWSPQVRRGPHPQGPGSSRSATQPRVRHVCHAQQAQVHVGLWCLRCEALSVGSRRGARQQCAVLWSGAEPLLLPCSPLLLGRRRRG